MSILNAIVCTDINGARSYQGNPLFKDDPFVKSCFELFTAEATIITPLINSMQVRSKDHCFLCYTPMDAIKEAKALGAEEIWILGEAVEGELLVPYCQNLVVIEVHETAPKSDEKFTFDYSKWKKVMAKECVSDDHQIGVYIFENLEVQDVT